MALGLGNYIYEIDLTNGGATYHFSDPDDPANTADATIKAGDVDGSPDSREAAELALSKVRDGLDEKRLSRIQSEEEADLKADHDREAKELNAREEYFSSAEDVTVQPHHVEADGTRVFSAAPAETPTPADDTNDKKKKK